MRQHDRFSLRALACVISIASLILNTVTTHTFYYHPAHLLTSSAYLPVRPPLPSLPPFPPPPLPTLISNTTPALSLTAMAPHRHPRHALRAPVADWHTWCGGEPPGCGVCGAVCGGDGYDWAAASLVWVGDCGEDGADDVGCGVVVGDGVSVPLGPLGVSVGEVVAREEG